MAFICSFLWSSSDWKSKKLTRQTFLLTGRNLGLSRRVDPIWFWFPWKSWAALERVEWNERSVSLNPNNKSKTCSHGQIQILSRCFRLAVSVTSFSITIGPYQEWEEGGETGKRRSSRERDGEVLLTGPPPPSPHHICLTSSVLKYLNSNCAKVHVRIYDTRFLIWCVYQNRSLKLTIKSRILTKLSIKPLKKTPNDKSVHK